MDSSTEQRLQSRRLFTEFLDSDEGRGEYVGRVREMMARKQTRLLVDVADLRLFNAGLTRNLMRDPSTFVPPFEEALEDVVRNQDPKYLEEGQHVNLGLTGSFGFANVSPRELLTGFVGTMVQVEGIVTKCSIVRPKVVTSVHYCAATKLFKKVEYRDVTSLAGPPTKNTYPTKDEAGNLLTTEFGMCKYRDSQSITLQEMPECAPPGQLPRSVDIALEDDLVDLCKPGDRLRVVGIFKAVPSETAAGGSGVFRTLVVANSLQHVKAGERASVLDFETTSRIRSLAEEHSPQELFELLGDSLAPSICGHAAIKRALVLLLIGGVEKHLKNGGHLRGDINCLMVGDPSVAKSQLLRAVMHVAPLAISTTGRGSSGVGLTAAVTTDGETGERRLEAGAMVLADGGVVCIDEFDKMSDADRVAIHEVMEQQTVTIAKAGIHASLNARCSVVAAANPLYGSYDMSLSVTRNVALPDSLLSRFDLLFVVLDQTNPAADRQIAGHVLAMHSFRPAWDDGSVGLEGRGDGDGAHGGAEEEEGEDGGAGPREPANIYAKPVRRGGGGRRLPLTVAFLKKYIQYAKHRPRKPALTAEASECIASEYAEWRRRAFEDANATLPVTARTLETMIRLATAHAKMRMQNDVSKIDAEAALEVMRFALGAVEVTNRRAEKEEEEDKAKERAAKEAKAVAAKAAAAKAAAARTAAAAAPAGADEEEAEMADVMVQETPQEAAGGEEADVSEAAREAFNQALLSLLRRADDCSVDAVVEEVGRRGQPLSRQRCLTLLMVMMEQGRVMLNRERTVVHRVW